MSKGKPEEQQELGQEVGQSLLSKLNILLSLQRSIRVNFEIVIFGPLRFIY